ncbi:hypothetical protein [Thomasclavelia saccharogumia]|uniref:hypothetical protein n=1 Tax=Thomasclavelia saccharogumia TaxID=341225 RepID=UPI000A8B1CFD|nr:hypothetical protein [Thomasclavelia saccharogumia]
MKKSTFVATILGTVGGILFALGMCMALIPEWNAFRYYHGNYWNYRVAYYGICLAKNGK